jgi:lambda family phage minor tail protein L
LLPRPTLIFSNLLGTITTIILRVNKTTAFIDLQRAKVTRRRTLARFLDEENFPSNVNPFKVGSVDPTAELPREVYFIDKKQTENRNIVEFEMVSSFDLAGVGAPKKLVTRDDFAGVGTFVNF